MAYKTSAYNLYIPITDYNVYLLYNSISNGLYEIEFEKGKKLSEIEKISEQELCDFFDPQERDFLTRGQIIIPEQESQWETLEKRLEQTESFKKNNGINLTLLPTYECNLACPYCFEKTKPKGKMTDVVMDRIITLVRNLLSQETILGDYLSVTWYGGEPLLYPDIIKEASKKLLKVAEENNLRYIAHIITNGVYLDEKGWKTLVDAKVTSVQITMDGYKETHNKSRPSKNGTDSYSLILENLKKIPEEIPKVVIRINANKANVGSFKDFLQDLKNKGLWPQKRDKIKLSFSHMRPYKFENTTSAQDFFTVPESVVEGRKFYYLKKQFLTDFYKREMKDAFTFPNFSPFICTTTHNPWGMVIDPFGRIYKCWEDVDKDYRQICSLEEEYSVIREKINNNTTINFNRLTADEECKQCKFLPICTNSCPIRFLDRDNNYKFCSPWKFQLEEILIAQYRRIQENPEDIYHYKTIKDIAMEKAMLNDNENC